MNTFARILIVTAWTVAAFCLAVGMLILAGGAHAQDVDVELDSARRVPFVVGEYGECGKLSIGPKKATWRGCKPINDYLDAHEVCAVAKGRLTMVCITPTPTPGPTRTASPPTRTPVPTATFVVRRCPTSCPPGKSCDAQACGAFGTAFDCSCH